MCQKKSEGGMRCASHTKADLTKAIAAYEANQTDEAREKMEVAQNAYNGTPEGIKALRAKGEWAEADLQVSIREARLAEAKTIKHQAEAEKMADEAIRKRRLAVARSAEGIAKLRAAGKHALADKFDDEADLLEDVQSSNPSDRSYAAKDPNLPVDMQETLAEDTDYEVVLTLAQNKEVSGHVLKSIAENSYIAEPRQLDIIRENVAKNPKAPWDVASKYMHLVDGKDDYIIGNENVPTSVLQDIASSHRFEQTRIDAQTKLYYRDKNRFAPPAKVSSWEREDYAMDGIIV